MTIGYITSIINSENKIKVDIIVQDLYLKTTIIGGKEMKRNKGKKLKDTNGITLIALIITIIALLILARSITKYGIKSKWDI